MSTKYKTNKLHSSNIETPRVTTPRMILNKLRQCYRPDLFPPALILFVNPGIQNTRTENEIETIYGENIIIIIGSHVLIDFSYPK